MTLSEAEVSSYKKIRLPPNTMVETFFTYIALCSDQSFYVGITNNIFNREKRHNAGHGSIYTRGRRPIKIIYFEEYTTRKQAAQRESQLKGWTRKKKILLIQGKLKNS
jgi:putative endonuclease